MNPKMVLSTSQGREYIEKTTRYSTHLREGSTFSKWVVENQKHHIHQVKKVTGQPEKALDII
jgi:hypothetical protein